MPPRAQPPSCLMSPIWARLFVGFVLLFASPGVAQVTHEVLSIMLDIDCCDGECESGDDARCPGGTCTHCMGAAVATVATPALPSTGIASHALRPPSRGLRLPCVVGLSGAALPTTRRLVALRGEVASSDAPIAAPAFDLLREARDRATRADDRRCAVGIACGRAHR